MEASKCGQVVESAGIGSSNIDVPQYPESLSGSILEGGLRIGEVMRKAMFTSVYAFSYSSASSPQQRLEAHTFDLRGKTRSKQRFMERHIAQKLRKSNVLISNIEFGGVRIIVIKENITEPRHVNQRSNAESSLVKSRIHGGFSTARTLSDSCRGF
jgi:hypothetical protein